MKPNQKEQKAPGKKSGTPKKDLAKSITTVPKQKMKVGAEEFEEDQSMELRMKPQPLTKAKKQD